MWVGGPPAGAGCAMPGRAVQCCNMFNASLTGTWPNCHPVGVTSVLPGPRSGGDRGGEGFGAEFSDKSGLRDSPLCYPQFPSDKGLFSPGFDGAFCFCKDAQQGALWSYCASPPSVPEQINLQLSSPTSVVVSFVTFNDAGSLSAPPAVRYAPAASARSDAQRTVRGVTHVYGMNATGHNAVTDKKYFLHFVRLVGLAERTRYTYSVRSGGTAAGEWSAPANFTTLYSSGTTRLALFVSCHDIAAVWVAFFSRS